MTSRRRRITLGTIAAALAAAAGACGGGPRTVEVPPPVPAAAAALPETAAARPAAPWRPAQARLLTRWAADVRPDTVLPEYPRPQMVRPRWQSLNGLWEFAVIDSSAVPGVSGDPHRLPRPSRPGAEGPRGPLPAPPPGIFGARGALINQGPTGAQRILVPFAPEAALSGVGRHADHVAYRRGFRNPSAQPSAERLLLHVGACDWHCTIYVNGRLVGDHTGGYDAFTVDVTDALIPGGENELVVAAYDPTDKFGQPRGKQVSNAEGIWYTPVTGLWQSVWLEPVPTASIARLHMTPDPSPDPSPSLRSGSGSGSGQAGSSRGGLRLTVVGRGTGAGQRVEAVATSNGREVGRADGAVGEEIRIPVPDARLWSPEDPFLYDLRVTLRDAGGAELDRVDSYFGMRSSTLMTDAAGHRRIALNGRPMFQLGPLDQGWWPDGLYTAPTDEALRYDIEMTKALGFNMTRKHIKVEPARWYYWADRLGLAVWQDMPSGWNDSPEAQGHFERELRAMLEDLHSVPSIVVWVPFNEKWGQFDTKRIVGVVRGADSSRLINDASGWQHEDAGDIIDVHRYQGPQAMRGAAGRVPVVGEFGGLGYKESGHAWAGDAWGYGGLFPSREALAERYDLLVRRLFRDRDTHGIGAGVYTQLTDVEVELNGFMTYDRAVMKFDTARVSAVNRGLAPDILPELAEFTDAVRVTISAGAAGAEIRYTTDGSEPTASSPVYRAPFTLRRDATVRARTFASGAPTAAPEARVAYRKGPGRPALAAAAARGVVAGLAYAVYRDTTPEPAFRMHWPVRWQLERPEARPNDIAPSKTGTVATPTLEPADTTELFGMRFTGYVRVPRTGVYTFTALSDDGAAMWVGERNVFWSVGQSPKTTETWGQVALQAGLHPITLTYFQAYGPMALELWVEGPGLPRQRVPARMLFRDRPPPPGAAAATPASR